MIEIDWTLSLPFLFSLALGVFTYFRTRRQDVDELFKDGSKQMAELDQRLATVEQRIRDMPERDDMHRMELTLTEMAGSLNTMSERMRSQYQLMQRLEGIVTRHEDHLREKS